MKYEEFEYEFEIEVPVGTPDYWSGDETYKKEIVKVVYPADIDDVKNCLYELLDNVTSTGDVLEEFINNNYDELVDKHYDYIKEQFEDEAYQWLLS